MQKQKAFDIQEFFCKTDYEHWNGVFEEYASCTDLFVRVFRDQYKKDDTTDAPYWNGERSNVGILATACWKNGWVALEEYSTTKKDGTGRCDLWVSSQDGDINYAIEAKKGYCSLDSGNLISRLLRLLDSNSKNGQSACGDARNLSVDEGDERMGIVFMHLYLDKGKKSKADQYIKKLFASLKEIVNKRSGPDFLFIYIKDNGVESDSNSIIPGVIIAGKKV